MHVYLVKMEGRNNVWGKKVVNFYTRSFLFLSMILVFSNKIQQMKGKTSSGNHRKPCLLIRHLHQIAQNMKQPTK